MRILITGAKGFVGRNLTEHLRSLGGHTLYLCDLDTPDSELAGWCREADFVFHLAGVNRPENPEEFLSGNRDALSTLEGCIERLKELTWQAIQTGRPPEEKDREEVCRELHSLHIACE